MPASSAPPSSSPVSGTRRPVVTFLSDFGTDDIFVGVCHGVVLRHAPDATIIDLTHAVPPQDVVTGAHRLEDGVGHLPAAVHLAVVDPGVGSARAAVIVEAGPVDAPSFLVGPDNGLLLPAAARLGGLREAWALPVPAAASATFHGRDVFAPAAGRLAAGWAPSELGAPLGREPRPLASTAVAAVDAAAGTVRSPVRDVDRFGNVQTYARADAVPALGGPGAVVVVEASSGPVDAVVAATFADVDPGRFGVIVDSFGWLAVIVGSGDAAGALGFDRGTAVTIRS